MGSKFLLPLDQKHGENFVKTFFTILYIHLMQALKKIGFYTAFVLPAIWVFSFYQGGWFQFMPVFFVFVVLPLFDQLIGIDKENVKPELVQQRSAEFYYRFVTYVWVYVQIGFLCWAAYVIATQPPVHLYEWIGFIISTGLVTGGIGITVAHELGHKQSGLERFYSKVLLMSVCYMHFYIEHNRGHHVTVATPEDPATARQNENFYAFWFRSVFGGYAHAWALEKESLKRKGQAIISLHNNMIAFTLLPLLFCAFLIISLKLITGLWQIEVLIFFFSQSIVAFTLLELVNYIEHYGIVRREVSPGKYERVNPLHSWNASHMLSNFFLFQLQRHSDHHAYAHKRYQVLNHYDESPQLPFGYPTMIVLAMFPPIWFALMNPRLKQWKKTNNYTTAVA
jgi:alkane 1-monooxygenase